MSFRNYKQKKLYIDAENLKADLHRRHQNWLKTGIFIKKLWRIYLEERVVDEPHPEISFGNFELVSYLRKHPKETQVVKPQGVRFLFSLFEYESSCHVSTAQKSEIFIIPTFPAGRAGRSVPCPVRVKFLLVKGILNSFRRIRRGTGASSPLPPLQYSRLREPTYALAFSGGAPLRNLTFFTSSVRIDISPEKARLNESSRFREISRFAKPELSFLADTLG